MATVQMPDGQLVELPDSPDDDQKELIRQTLEAARNQPQPQGGSPTPTPAPAADVVERTGETGLVFAPRSGAQEDVSEARQVAEIPQVQAAGEAAVDLAKGVPGMVASLPRFAGEGLKFATGGPQERGQVVADLLGESVPMGRQMAQEVSAPLGTRESFRGLAQILMMAAPAVGELAGAFSPMARPPVQTGLRSAFDPLFKKTEPISPTPLSDAATTEVTDNASKITSGTGMDLREQGGGVGETPSLRQQGPVAGAGQEEAQGGGPTPTTPVGGAPEQVTSVAIRNKETGQVTTGVNHTDAFLKVSPDALDADEWSGIKKPLTDSHEKGFVTSSGRFVSPKEGHAIQTGQSGELTHEDVTPSISPELVAATEPSEPTVAQPEPTAPAPPTTYFKGDKAEYTGNTHELHGGTFYEVKMLEGNDAGKTKVVANPPPQAPTPKLLPGETQGDLLTSTQQEPLKLVGETTVDHEAKQLEADAAAEEKANAEKGQTTFEDLAQTLTKEEEDAIKSQYEQGLLEDVQQYQEAGGRELLDAVKALGGLRIDEPHFGDLKEAFQKKAGFSKLASGEEGYRYKDIFQKNALAGDQLVQALRAEGFDIENPGHLADMLDHRFKTGKKVYGVEARAQEGGISGLQGYGMGAAGTKEIPARGWKDMLESGEKTPVETTDSLARAKGTIGKVLDAIAQGYRNIRDFMTVDAVPKLTRAGLADAAYEHASARSSIVHSVRHLLSRVFPDEYKNPAAMQRTGDILTKDNILGVYDQAQERLAQAEPGTPEYDAAADALSKIEESHNLASYDKDVQEAMKDPKLSRNIERWKTWVNPEMDRMYNEIKGLDQWAIQEPRGRHFGARINLLPLNQAADLAAFADTSRPMPDIVTSNYRNPNIKQDPFMRRAAGTGQYSTDPGLILTNSLARRYNEVTKLRLYNAVEKTGNGFITEPGDQPNVTKLGGEDLTRLAIKMPETNPETGRTRPVEKSLWIKKSLARETRDVLNTDMAAPTNPVFKAITQLQLLQLTDATAHMKNIHTVVANSLGASKPWQDAVRKMPFLATADTVGRIASVTRDVAADTPAIRDEIAQMAKQGMIRPKYPSTGVQRITKMQDAIHHVDTAARIVMNRFWDNLVERGMVNDSMQARRAFVQQIGEYNGRLMGHFSRAMRNYGASPFVVAGRTFNAFSKRLLTGDPGFKAATPQAAAAARAYQLTALTLATTVPAIINYAITGKFGGRPGTPIGAIDTGMDNEKGAKKIIDLFQLMGIRRGLRATGAGAVIEGVREGKSLNLIGGKAIDDITSTASHPWLGPALTGAYSGLTGKRLDLRGGGWPFEAKRIKEGGLKQNAENLRVALKNQNPMIYGLLAPLIGETEDTYGAGLMRGFIERPLFGPFGYAEKPGDSAFGGTSKKSTGVKVKP